MKKIVLAIDGPAASGKSTTAKLTAKALNYIHIDTGAMYRTLTLKAINDGIDLNSEDQVYKSVKDCKVTFSKDNNVTRVFLDCVDVTEKIRNSNVTNNVSLVSSYKSVREKMVEEQRRLAKDGGVVLEGRDIGTVVVPDAELKIFMVATIEQRVKRRQKELVENGTMIEADKLVFEIMDRDEKDSKRKESPLRKADDAIILDTSDLTIDEQVDFIVNKALKLINK